MRRLAAVLGALLLCAACSEPPHKEIERAQGAIDAARAAGADRYARDEYEAATTALQQAHDASGQGDYRTALSRALSAHERAQNAAREAADTKARSRAEAEVGLTAATTALQQLRTSIKAAEQARTPAAQLAGPRQAAQKIDARLQEAREHIKAERYPDAAAVVKNVIPTANEEIRKLTELAAKTPPARRRR